MGTSEPLNNSKLIASLVDSLSRPEPPQAQEGKPGDPQLSALCQFLLQMSEKGQHQVIVDFGCGNGVLAHFLDKVYSGDKQTPQYWAIDLPESLNSLSLPVRIHNNSKKYATDYFLNTVLPNTEIEISTFVLRNVLHELDIVTTAKLFTALKTYLSPSTLIYIQDMARLAKPERGNVGWNKDLLVKCLEELNFKAASFDLISYGGVPWFSIICSVSLEPSEINVQKIVAKYRTTQLEMIETQVIDASQDWENTTELLLLQHEFTSLALQLRRAGSLPYNTELEPSLQKMNIPTSKPQSSQFEYTCTMGPAVSSNSGLIAMISNKNLLDFPALISSAKKIISFGGYSNRPLFLSINNKIALNKAILKGVIINVLVVDPASRPARLRAEEPIYDSPEQFIINIETTIELGKKFYENIVSEIGMQQASKLFKFKASARTPRWSYFIVDDTCYLSFYSITMTGSAAPCFIFRGLPGVINNYYHVVKQEFTQLFEESINLI
jgi:hypothetical protein